MAYKLTDKKFESVKRFFDEVWKDPSKYPDKGLILSLDDKEITKIFTKERIKLIKLIKTRKIKSLSELAKKTKRELSAIDRDLKLLERLGIVTLKKEGKTVKPIVEKEILILPLIEFETKTIDKLEKKVYV